MINLGLQTDADGYVRGMLANAQEQYLRGEDLCQHPPLSNTYAKLVVRECPEEAFRAYSARLVVEVDEAEDDSEEDEQTDAKRAGSLLDALMTGQPYPGKPDALVRVPGSAKSKSPDVLVERWNGLLIVDTDAWRSSSAKAARDMGTAEGLTVVKRSAFDRERRRLEEIAVRLELAGVSTDGWLTQVAVYWVETASDGTPVQCRGLLDFLRPDAGAIADLKRVHSLRGDRLAYAVDSYGWHIQSAAYSRAVLALTGEWPEYDWHFVRAVPRVAVAVKPAGATMLECGQVEWLHAVDEWARGLKSGLWRGYEADRTPLEATPNMISRTETLKSEMDEAAQ